MTVTNAVQSLGAHVNSVSSTKAEIELRNGLTKDTVILAIQNAGYKVLV